VAGSLSHAADPVRPRLRRKLHYTPPTSFSLNGTGTPSETLSGLECGFQPRLYLNRAELREHRGVLQKDIQFRIAGPVLQRELLGYEFLDTRCVTLSGHGIWPPSFTLQTTFDFLPSFDGFGCQPIYKSIALNVRSSLTTQCSTSRGVGLGQPRPLLRERASADPRRLQLACRFSKAYKQRFCGRPARDVDPMASTTPSSPAMR